MKLQVFLFLTIIFGVSCNHSSEEFTPTFTLSENTLFKISEEQKYQFGYLEVPENRNISNSRTIKLPVYIFKSRNPNPKQDPIIYTVGGPGSTTMPSAQYMKYYRYLDDRDFILFEQRGTQYAEPPLDCPELAKAAYLSNLPNFDKEKSDSLFENAVINCRSRMVRNKIDLNGYNTNEIAADIDALAKTLSLVEYNLLTISYSTKIAQVLLRDYPQKIRSVVMDSPLPLEVNYDEESISNLMDAMDKLFMDCADDRACGQAFPNQKRRFFEYLQTITENPLNLNVVNPKTNKEEVFYLKGKDLLTVFTDASTGSVLNIPKEIEKILNGDFSTIKKRLTSLFDEPGKGAGRGMRLSVWCAEEYPFNNPEKIRF